jgi:hypothetical protein
MGASPWHISYCWEWKKEKHVIILNVEIGCSGIEWIASAQDRGRWRILVNKVMLESSGVPAQLTAYQDGLSSTEFVC